MGTKGYAITPVLIKPCSFQIPLSAALEENFVLTSPSEDRQTPTARA